MYTTLTKIQAMSPYPNTWKKLLPHLKKVQADDEPLSIETVLDKSGLENALSCLFAVDGYEREKRLFAVACARQVQHLMTDPRSHVSIDIAEQFANGHVSSEALAVERNSPVLAPRAARVARDVCRDSAALAAEAAAGLATNELVLSAWRLETRTEKARTGKGVDAARMTEIQNLVTENSKAVQSLNLREIIRAAPVPNWVAT